METSFNIESIARDLERAKALVDEGVKIMTLAELQLQALRRLAVDALDVQPSELRNK